MTFSISVLRAYNDELHRLCFNVVLIDVDVEYLGVNGKVRTERWMKGNFVDEEEQCEAVTTSVPRTWRVARQTNDT